ncbi:MAG: hypothetical protein ACTIJ9_11110 [Aequorivita sp.]
MKTIYILLLLCVSCVSKNEQNQTIETKNITSKFQESKGFDQIISIELKRNSAMDYFFTRKYKLTENNLYYYSESNKLEKMKIDDYLLAKKLIDSLPDNVLNNKKNLGHPTVMIDIPDWEIIIYFKSQDTILISSGDLPEFMKSYENMAWDIIAKLDDKK